MRDLMLLYEPWLIVGYGSFALIAVWVLFKKLESSGRFGSPGLQLSGAAAGFMGIFGVLLSYGLPDAEARSYWFSSRPAGQTIVQFYRLVDSGSEANLAQAFELTGDAWRNDFISDLERFKKAYATTIPGTHQRLQVTPVPGEVTPDQEEYLVSFDVEDRFPRLTSQQELANRTLAELRSMATDAPGILRETLVRDMSRHFQVSGEDAQRIRDFWDHSTIGTLMRLDLARTIVQQLGLSPRQGTAMDTLRVEVMHHLRKRITVVREPEGWRIADVRTLIDDAYDASGDVSGR